jgi:predicted esterase
MTQPNLHAGRPILHAGVLLEQARVAMLLVHGRGGSADDIISLAGPLQAPDVAYFAPQAANNTWYPNRFIAPVATNEPWLTYALELLGALLGHIADGGVPPERTILLGFSQGACLTVEYAARNPQRYGGVAVLSGALIENGDAPREYAGSLAGTPLFLGCNEIDPHIPSGRVERSAEILTNLDAAATLRFYPGAGHTIYDDEIEAVRAMIDAVRQG